MKKILLYKFLTSLLLVVCLNKANAQIKCKIEHYSTEEGLSHEGIRDIIKDKEGFMWFATWDGINRFDGKNFITYKAIAGDNSSLGNNRIDLMKEDASGHIWFKAYDGQIYRFKKSTESFLSIASFLGTNKITFDKIIPTTDGNVWLTTLKNGIYLTQKEIHKKIKIIHFDKHAGANLSIASNDLNFVIKDESNTIWVGSENGLDRIAKSKHQLYTSTSVLKNNNVQSLALLDKNVWFGTDKGLLFCYNKSSKKCNKLSISSESINSIIKSKKEDLLYITTSEGELITFNINSLKTESILKISDSPIYKIYQDQQNMLWIEPEKKGVIMVNPTTKKIQLLSQKIDATLQDIQHSFDIFEDNFDRVWIKLKGGGFGYYNRETNTLDYFINKPGDDNQKFSNIISSMYFDPAGILWISTNDRGINKIIFQKNTFQQHLLVPKPENKSENDIRALYTDKLNRLWISSKAGKLRVYKDNQHLTNLFVNHKNKSIGDVYSIAEDEKGNIWLGTKGQGLYKATPTDIQNSQYVLKQFKADKDDPHSISSNLIYCILKDKKKRIWIGTYGSGLNLLEENNGEYSFIHDFKNYPLETSSRIRYMIEGYNNSIWVATTNGLVTFKPENYKSDKMKFSRYVKISSEKNSIGNNDVLFMYKDSEDKIWVSTAGGGLNLAIKTKDKGLKFKNFTRENGLPSDFILSMTEDDEKKLWLATENGISKFDLRNHTFRNYDSNDGLVNTQFSESSSLKLPNGNFIFGCRNGYLSFDPRKIETEKITTKMVFTNFEINNKPSAIKSEEFPLKNNINYNNNIQLSYLENTVSVYYTVLDYKYSNKQLYAYRLIGLDDTWHPVKNQKKATFTNLPPGDYQFEVKCLNPELYTNIPQKSLTFTITPPFWKTTWAYLIYFIISLILLEIIRRTIYSMIRLRNKVVVEQKMTELKLSFFTNISHELRTPLTLIVNPINEIAKNEQLSPIGNDYIETVKKNTNRMVRFVNQLLDFRKVQSGNEELQIESIELISFINELNALFSHAAYEKNIKIKIASDFETLTVNLDKKKMDIVIYNLLSNAIKFSPNNSTITIELKTENNVLQMNITDQGPGVEENKLEDIFKLYYETETGKSKNVGTGIGLALCKEYIKLHNGSIHAINNSNGGLTISITIDLNNKIFQISKKEINTINKKLKTHHSIIKENKTEPDTQNTRSSTILLVEDNTELRAFIKSQLQRYYQIIEAENGKEGLAIATEKLPDLILSDVMMPEMDGIELLDALKNAAETSHIPVILLTAKSSVESQIEGLTYGADYYITKPFDTDFLLASIENLINNRKKIFENLRNNIKKIALEPGEIIITTKDEQFLKDIISIVEKEIINPKFNIDIIANSMNMARVTFNRKFKSLTNITPVEFVKEMRVKRARQFLDAGETDIADIAYKVGFNSAGYFSTCFKELYKISPSDYLKQKPDN